MIITLVVAASENNVIGRDNKLPWHLPDDLKFFKKTTLGKPVLMGRKTWESMNGKPLPGRTNIVLSGSAPELPPGVLLFSSIREALSACNGEPEVCIIGGGQIFNETLDLADNIYLTRVHTTIEDGSVFFPELDAGLWQLSWQEHHEADERHAFAFTFQHYEKVRPR